MQAPHEREFERENANGCHARARGAVAVEDLIRFTIERHVRVSVAEPRLHVEQNARSRRGPVFAPSSRATLVSSCLGICPACRFSSERCQLLKGMVIGSLLKGRSHSCATSRR
jgi:hypothetical protein